MDIYFTDISSISDKKNGKTHRRFSRTILSMILKRVYNKNEIISDDNGRPYIDGSDLHFSISHSKDIIAIAFNDNDGGGLGFDIEYKRERDYKKILQYYRLNIETINSDMFYQLWTTYEAEYKMGAKSENTVSFRYGDYIATLVSEKASDINIYKTTLSLPDKIEEFSKYILNPSDILPKTEMRIKQ